MILRYLETGGYHVDLIVIRRPFSMNENSVTTTLLLLYHYYHHHHISAT